MHSKLYIASPSDRDTITPILVKNGYTVRYGKEKQGNKMVTYIEYWEGTN